MEFKYRAVDEPPPSSPPYRHPTTSSSGYSCLGQQAIKAGYRIPSSGGANEYFNSGPGRANDCFNEGLGQVNEYNTDPIDLREEIQRELEKERIREEIIAAEIARRQALEAEVRREMMIERELALLARRGQVDALDRFLFPFGGGMEFEPRDVSFLHNKGLSLEERIAMSLEERLGMRERRETGRVETVPFHHGSIEVMSSPADVKKDKDKIVIMAEPNASLSEAKQKAVPPEGEDASDLSGGVSKKKVREEWSCALCQVSATSERDLNNHIQGKKHKSKAAALRVRRNGIIGIGTFPKKDIKPSVKITRKISSEMGLKPRGKLSQFNQTRESSLQVNSSTKRKKENNVSSFEESDKTDNARKENLGVQKAPKKEQKEKKIYTFWREMCQVGACNENVMEAHRKGKRHMHRLQEAEENDTTNRTPQNVGIQAANVADEATMEGDNINNEDDASLLGAMQKAAPPEEERSSDLSGGVSKEKVTEEWSCVLCQVSVASERGLNDHIQGKKHKSKAAALRVQTNGNNNGMGTFPKKDINPSVESAHKISSEMGLKPRGELSQFNQTRESSVQIKSSTERMKENNVSILEESDKTDNTRKENLGVQKAPKKEQKEKKIYTFWREMCQVGACNENVMEAHRKGKRHMHRLQEAEENDTTNRTPQNVGIQAANVADEATMEGDNINNEDDASLLGAMQKAAPPEEERSSDLSGGVSKEKVTEEWSCVLCQVSVASERGLNDHIQGKKHKSKAAALRVQTNGNNNGMGTFPKKDINPSVESAHKISSEMGLKPRGELSQFNQTRESSVQIKSSTERMKENNVSILEESDKTDNTRKENLGVQKAPKKEQKEKKIYTFWCEMCQVGAHNENVMEAHRKGKKHMHRLQEAKENGTTNRTPQNVFIQAANVADEATMEGDNINNEDADGAKPDASLLGAKQKAVPLEEEGASDLSGGVSEKKVKEEWSCTLGQVRATSECNLNDHIQGKKHKSKEVVLRAQRNVAF